MPKKKSPWWLLVIVVMFVHSCWAYIVVYDPHCWSNPAGWINPLRGCEWGCRTPTIGSSKYRSGWKIETLNQTFFSEPEMPSTIQVGLPLVAAIVAPVPDGTPWACATQRLQSPEGRSRSNQWCDRLPWCITGCWLCPLIVRLFFGPFLQIQSWSCWESPSYRTYRSNDT